MTDGDLRGRFGIRLQGAGRGIVDEGDLSGTQVADDVADGGWRRGALFCGLCSGQEDVQGRQMGQDPILADVEVLRTVGIARR